MRANIWTDSASSLRRGSISQAVGTSTEADFLPFDFLLGGVESSSRILMAFRAAVKDILGLALVDVDAGTVMFIATATRLAMSMTSLAAALRFSCSSISRSKRFLNGAREIESMFDSVASLNSVIIVSKTEPKTSITLLQESLIMSTVHCLAVLTSNKASS